MEHYTTNLIGIKIGSEFGILHDQYLGFDPRFKVTFERAETESILLIEAAESSIENFFGPKVSYLTGIVGKNGVGKSTTLRYIKELFIKENRDQEPRENDVILFKEEGSIKIYISQTNRNKYRIENQTELSIDEIFFREYPKVLDRIKNFTTIYYSNSLETDYNETETLNYYNISTGYLKENSGKINNRLRSKKIRALGAVKKYKYTELKRQSEFLSALAKQSIRPDIPFQGIGEIQMNLVPMNDKDYHKFNVRFSEVLKRREDEEINDGYRRELIDRLAITIRDCQDRFVTLRDKNAADREKFILNFYENLIHHLLKLVFTDAGLLRSFENDPSAGFELLDAFRDNFDYIKEDFSRFNRLTIHLIDILKKERASEVNYQRTQNNAKSDPMIGKLEDISALESFFRKNWNHLIYRKNIIVFPTVSPEFHELFDNHYGTALDISFLTFKWSSLSAGEESLISYFSRLYSVLSDIKNKNVLMLIDEGDLYFHPEWQRDYIYFLLEFLNSDLLDANGIQIIITTHSPFIISDLPKENIILLVKEQGSGEKPVVIVKAMETHTFGGNIHSLFTEAFFLGDSVTSRFAKRKIKSEVIGYLETVRPNPNQARYISSLIERVGEPVLKRILLERFNQKNNG